MLLDTLYQYSQTDRIAAYDGSAFISFRELWERSDAIAAWLLKNYPSKDPLAIFGDKENDMLSCMFGAIKSGHPYVCIPSYYPMDRINAIVADSGAAVVLNPAPVQIHEVGLPVLSRDEMQKLPAEAVEASCYAQPGDLVCMLYTSGSTGTPKAVRVTYENLLAKIVQTEEFMGPSMQAECGHAVNLAAYSFSASLSYVYYVMLYAGWTLYCVPRTVLKDVNALLDYLEEINPDVFSCTPSMADRLLSAERFNPEHFPHMHYTCLGGEPLLIHTVKNYKERFPGIRLINGMGMTEATAAALTCEITDELMATSDTFFPVGLTSTPYGYLMDDDGNRVTEDGQAGELIVSCKTVCDGYHNRPELTAENFFTDSQGVWSYHTRDLLKIRNGYYYYVGRKDNQVKIGGNRFELEDVEANMRRVPVVRECATAVKTLEDGTRTLVGFVVKADSTVPNMKAIMTIKQQMQTMVESYMIPSKIVFVDALPKNVNLKLDRAAVKKMAEEA